MSWPDQAAKILRSHVPAGSRLLAAVSGGPDSVALAHFLRGQPYSLVIGHVDHGLRATSRRDAQFVRRLAAGWDIPYGVKRVRVKAHAKNHHLGIEEAARHLRYQALAAIARRHQCAAILTAHTADDQSETVLMNFLRGAGPAGLAGISAARALNHSQQVPIVRPFLKASKNEILAYVKRHSLVYRKDPTNSSLVFSRNRIRHVTLPYLDKLYPGLGLRLLQTANIFREEEDFWEKRLAEAMRKTVRKDREKITVVLPQLLRYHKAVGRRILRFAFPGLSFKDIEHVMTLAQSPQRKGWRVLSGSWQVKREKNKLVAVQKRTG